MLAYRYSEKLLREVVDTEDPTVEKVEALLLMLDDIRVEVESCRAELPAIHPDRYRSPAPRAETRLGALNSLASRTRSRSRSADRRFAGPRSRGCSRRRVRGR
jgi:hypothetical protein